MVRGVFSPQVLRHMLPSKKKNRAKNDNLKAMNSERFRLRDCAGQVHFYKSSAKETAKGFVTNSTLEEGFLGEGFWGGGLCPEKCPSHKRPRGKAP